ncbi:MAG: pilus assembly protein TadG-related protein [Litoreibacter sp.]
MKHLFKNITSRTRLLDSVSNFRTRDDGAMLVFGLFLFAVMLVASGMAIDFMRHENQRTLLQSSIDRAVLAAADLDQQNDPVAVVEDYLAKSGLTGYTLDIDADVDGIVHRNVTVQAKTDLRTMFLNIVGIDELEVPARTSAGERVNNVEVSLVLDVSGSMGNAAQGATEAKIVSLRSAAQNFVDTLLRPSTKDRVSISLVPYTGQTNAGPDLIKYFNLDRVHSHSHCIEFNDADFVTPLIPFDAALEQAQHFGWADNNNRVMDNPVCSDKESDEIFAFQNDATEINKRIADFEPRSRTAIHVAMKWAVSLLDPSFQTVVDGLINEKKVDSVFSGRPSAYSSADDISNEAEETTKIVVLMTDGENVDKSVIPEALYRTEEDIQHFADTPFWVGDVNGRRFNLEVTQGARSTVGGRHSADENLDQICSVARDKGIVVFTIGYDLGSNPTARQVLSKCASSDSHAYEAGSEGLDVAFSAVARTITQLRLSQ